MGKSRTCGVKKHKRTLKTGKKTTVKGHRRKNTIDCDVKPHRRKNGRS